MELYEFTEKEFNDQFQNAYAIITLGRVPVDSPKAFLLGGQSGAGKSTLYKYIKKQNNNNYVEIDGDSFRRFHPNAIKLKEKYGKDDVDYTAKFAGKMVGSLIDRLSDEKYNLIIEGTLRTSETPISTAKELKSKGYDNELSVMAVKPELSYVSTLMRYETAFENEPNQARATHKSHHDLIINKLPANLDQVMDSGLFSKISLITRNEDVIYDSSKNDLRPSVAIKDFWNQPWSQDEYEMFKQSIELTESLRDKRQYLDNSDLNELSQTVDTKILTQLNGLEQNPEEYNL